MHPVWQAAEGRNGIVGAQLSIHQTLSNSRPRAIDNLLGRVVRCPAQRHFLTRATRDLPDWCPAGASDCLSGRRFRGAADEIDRRGGGRAVARSPVLARQGTRQETKPLLSPPRLKFLSRESVAIRQSSLLRIQIASWFSLDAYCVDSSCRRAPPLCWA